MSAASNAKIVFSHRAGAGCCASASGADNSPIAQIKKERTSLTVGSRRAHVKRNAGYDCNMRYLVTARPKVGRRAALDRAIEDGTLGSGSVAGDEYAYDMEQARELPDGRVKWVETCFCATPLEEERPYWEAYFDLLSVKDAHARSKCQHENGTQRWACENCDCTERLERRLEAQGRPFRGPDGRAGE